MKNDLIDIESLRLSAAYIECASEILKEVYAILPDAIKEKYSMKILDSGAIDIQFPMKEGL